MTTITPFPIRRHPTAEPQRTTCDAGRSARALPHVRSTYPSRPALAAAICVSWTIALVAGVVLAMEILR